MRVFIALFMMFFAAAAQAAPFYQGVWVADGMTCDNGLKITKARMFGLENQCVLEDPVAIRGLDGILFDRFCEGEGMKSKDRILFLNGSDGRLTIFNAGFTVIYDRCP